VRDCKEGKAFGRIAIRSFKTQKLPLNIKLDDAFLRRAVQSARDHNAAQQAEPRQISSREHSDAQHNSAIHAGGLASDNLETAETLLQCRPGHSAMRDLQVMCLATQLDFRVLCRNSAWQCQSAAGTDARSTLACPWCPRNFAGYIHSTCTTFTSTLSRRNGRRRVLSMDVPVQGYMWMAVQLCTQMPGRVHVRRCVVISLSGRMPGVNLAMRDTMKNHPRPTR
jgi:hypothetical protein